MIEEKIKKLEKTPHIEVDQEGQIAKIVLMPGDPLRAKYIAETYLEDVKCFNKVRNMFGFTGKYHGKEVSVMGSGMGMPSIGIYSYELFKFYGVEKIIRIGSAGSYDPTLHIYDVVLVEDCYSESTYAYTQSGDERKIIPANKELLNDLVASAKELNAPYRVARIHSADAFYTETNTLPKIMMEQHNCVCVEMEAFALFHNAEVLGKKAACVLTISDSLVADEKTTSEQRQTSFDQMIKIALNVAK